MDLVHIVVLAVLQGIVEFLPISSSGHLILVPALLGTALLSAGGSALNHVWERDTDALMERTVDRPLPAGRLSSTEVLTFGAVTMSLGIAYLLLTVGWLTALQKTADSTKGNRTLGGLYTDKPRKYAAAEVWSAAVGDCDTTCRQ